MQLMNQFKLGDSSHLSQSWWTELHVHVVGGEVASIPWNQSRCPKAGPNTTAIKKYEFKLFWSFLMYQQKKNLLFIFLNVDTAYKKSLARHCPRGLKNQRIMKRNWRRLLYMTHVYHKDGTYVFSKTGTRPQNAQSVNIVLRLS